MVGAGGMGVEAIALVFFWALFCLALSGSSAGTLYSMDKSQIQKDKIIYHLNTFRFLQSLR